jgi:long-chain acyl-CoA synthetase
MDELKWFKNYDNEIPHTLEPYQKKSILDVFLETTKQKPGHICTIFKENSLSYGEIDKLSDALAAALVAGGVRKADTIAIALPNSPEALVSLLGVWKAKAIPAPLNPLYTEEEMDNGITECGAKAAIVLDPLYPVVKSFQGHHSRLRRVIPVKVAGYSPRPPSNRQHTERDDDTQITIHQEDVWFKELLANYANDKRPETGINPGDVAMILQSGGTAGVLRGIMLTHRAITAEAVQLSTWVKCCLANWEDAVLLNVPWFHVFGVAMLSLAIITHNRVVLVPDLRNQDEILETIRKTRPALIPGVPTFFANLLNNPAVKDKKTDLSGVKLFISGAAPLFQETKQQVIKLTGAKMMQAYGLTETAGAVIAEPLEKRNKPGSIGLPLPDVLLKIMDTETGLHEVPVGQPGEIVVKGPQVMLGFWNSLEDTAEMLRDGWLYTGDIGYMDRDGYIFITSRKKALIKVSGFQVWPYEVETVIRSHPAVASACVAGVPDVVQGESIKAWVVLYKGKKLTTVELREFCHKRLTGYKVPKHIEFRDSLPGAVYGQDLCRKLVAEDKLHKSPVA